MRENLLRKGVPDRKIAVLPNWVDLDVVRPTEKENPFRAELGLQGRFVVLFAGNIGFAAGLETVLEAAHRLRREADIVFLIVGEGSAKPALLQRTQDLELTNLRFVTSQPRERLSEVLGAADVSLVPLRDGMGALSVPSKTMAIMASGRPVLASVPHDSETRRVIEVSASGRWVGPGDAAALADEITRLRADRGGLESMGVNGRNYAEAHFGRSLVVSAYHRLLQEVAFDRPVERHSAENTGR
jgi:colanic acid biosynthesis glycosyl transferase WcaI